MSKHISQQFEQELQGLVLHIMEMGGIAEAQTRDACDAFVRHDGELGERVRQRDQELNHLEVQIDSEITQIIARRQPAANDLRMLTMAFKVITDLERIGDEAKRIAKMAVSLSQMDRPLPEYSEIRHLARDVQRLLRDALDAFARSDETAAERVIGTDDEIDEEYESVMRKLFTYAVEDSHAIRRVVNTMWTARALERIGDHAKNIGEYVVYWVRGTDVRHVRQLADHDSGQTGGH